MTLFEELVEHIVDSRLRLKSFGKATPILESNEPMDNLLIVINGRLCVQSRDTGHRLCYYEKDEIVAGGSLGLQFLSMSSDIDVSPRNLNKYFG